MKKKNAKLKLPVVKRKNRWYNTITKKYVSESYARRINRSFIKNPNMTLQQARGHYQYNPKKAMTEQSPEIRKLAYGSGTQLIKTRTLSGKSVHWSPIQNEFLADIPITDLKALDYNIQKNVKVELYRLTRDMFNIYHHIKWKVSKSFSEPLGLDFWLASSEKTYNRIVKELKYILKHFPFSKRAILYGNIHVYIYSDLDGWDSGIGFGFVLPYAHKNPFDILRKDFLDKIDHYKTSLENNSYRNLAILKIVFYVYDSTRNVSETARNLAKYRIGIIQAH